MKNLRTLAIVLLLASVQATVWSCSVVLDFTECASDADCQSLAGPGETLVCGADHTCVAGVECASTTDCADKGARTVCDHGTCIEPQADTVEPDLSDLDTVEPDTLDTTAPPDTLPETTDTVDTSDVLEPLPCTTHTQCLARGATHICSVSGFCEDVITEDCHHAVFPEVGRDNVVFLGSIIPTTPPFDELALPLERAVDLAVEDFNRAGGLPGGRKIVWIACDSAGSSPKAQRAATHLVHTVGVPAIIGPVLSTPFIDVTTSITANAGVLTISPSATSPNITGLDDSNLAWRVIPSDVYQSSAIADRMLDLGASRIVVFAKDDAYGGGLLTAMSSKLTAVLGTTNLHLATYQDPVKLGTLEAITAEITRVVSESVTAMPDADGVILLGTTEAIDIYGAHLASLGALGRFPDNDPPIYVFSHGVVPALERTLSHPNNVLGDIMIGFVEGVSPNVFDAANYDAFNLRYRSKFSNEDALTSTGLSYDATFVVLFAMSSLERDSVITGTNLAAAISKLVDKTDGLAVSFGATDFIATARNTLANGGTVDLKGVSGELDFDLATGDVRTNYLGWIVEKVSGLYTPKVVRAYLLDPPPATSGAWMLLP